MNLLCFSVILLVACADSEAPVCCSKLGRHTTCKYYCQQLLREGTYVQQMKQVLTAAEHCPYDLDEFWQCVNISVPVMRQLEQWSGRPCCDLAMTSACKQTCQRAHSMKDIDSTHCDRNTEKSLYKCLHRHSVGNKCCHQSVRDSCSIVCHSFFLLGSTTARANRDVVYRHCKGGSLPVAKCVQNQTRSARASIPQDNIPCCQKAKTQKCQEECERVLKTSLTDDEMVEALIKTCDSPDMRDPLWQCFLSPPVTKKNETQPATAFDSARLQCCAKASSDRCRELCTHTYTKSWTKHGSEFDKSCSFIQPVSVLEAPMHNCLHDVDEPCKLGCSQLEFCTNFNFRPTEPFRSCTRSADESARKTIEIWQKGIISLPQMTIPVKDIRECEPELWKAIACAVQIKPCHSKPSPISICQEDCIYILNKCVDYTRLNSDQSVPQLCHPLPKLSDPGACTSVTRYLTESEHVSKSWEVTSPCRPNPCRSRELCLVRRRKCKHKDNCKPYICKSACLLGHVSSFLVPHGAYVRIPDQQTSTRSQQCFKACRCGHRREVGNCSPLTCLQNKNCNMGPGHIKDHGSHFVVDGSNCICNAGHLICARRTCSVDPGLTAGHYTGMPGNCPATYQPMCGGNGKTFPNACLAKCAGLQESDLQIGVCSTIDPCQNDPCGEGLRCVARRQVCITGKNCLQHECIPATDFNNCNNHIHDPVCNTHGEEFTNACLLYSHGRKLAYRGHCMTNCADSGTVCGHNGETYPSECAALADRVTMDYRGECRAFGNLTANSPKTSTCAHIKCPELRPKHCHGVTPPGACCPICAAELQALFDPRVAEFAAKEMGGGPMSVTVLLNMLSDHLMVAECDVFGYLGVDGALIILIAPVTQDPTELQVEACISEARRLEDLIRTGSPTLMSYLTLTPLLLAPMRAPRLGRVNTAAILSPASLSVLVAMTILTLIVTRTKL
ncbi:reversion-inducing cysteine-rich protein with Kazal motifs-like [Haliotis rufescens]|uniref:reversion-inducing cysteine-rich protein with Kazal motifs-like n=1 Tax=Haliotis rufescens TaxID=6454 RepID=UPI001EB00460|nr:reversion-inducing cysteine-rich protein with Kazal motifs-like [Haliotis rufescens]